MCGFVGLFTPLGSRIEDAELDRRLEAIGHRGPDGRRQATLREGRFQAGFNRLAIIDLEASDQPLYSRSERFCLLGNGEIYNFVELRKRFADYPFATQGDMEVVFPALETLGDDFISPLAGMFALALYDSQDHRLTLVRDRLGIKPLYYAITAAGGILFASEPKALLAGDLIAPALDEAGVAAYLVQGYIPGNGTLYRGIYKLGPGEKLIVSASGETHLERYWRPSPATDAPPDAQSRRQWIADKLNHSVSEHLQSDVPLGALLSGGIDSGLVVALAAQLHPQPLKTFSVRFSGADYDETPLAEQVARRYGTEHETLVVSDADLVRDLVRLAWFMDEPLADPALGPNRVIEERLRERVTVTLNGTGGDELFGGYLRYFPHPLEQRYQRLPRALRTRLIEPLLQRLAPHRAWQLARADRRHTDPGGYLNDHTRVLPPALLARLGIQLPLREPISSRIYNETTGEDQARQLAADMDGYLAGNLLPLLDRTSMMESVEGRVPFLDHRLVEAALALPDAERCPDGRQKGFLRDLARDYLPEAVLTAPKRGFASPVPTWMAGELGPMAQRLLTSKSALERGIWTATGIKGLLAEPRRHAFALYALLMLDLTIRLHIEGRGDAATPLEALAETA
ncbi:MAG: asparagine synthase (glutamine-hydrolyzing) [Rhodospirillales bacterium]